MRAHPAVFEIVRCFGMGEDVDEKFTLWLQGSAYFRHEKLVILHVLEEFDGDDSIKRAWLELIHHDIARDHCQVREPLPLRFSLNKRPLCARIGECCDSRVWEELGEID